MSTENMTVHSPRICPVCKQEVIPGVDHRCPSYKSKDTLPQPGLVFGTYTPAPEHLNQVRKAHLLCPACGEHLIVIKGED